jgi:hypothetical protein
MQVGTRIRLGQPMTGPRRHTCDACCERMRVCRYCALHAGRAQSNQGPWPMRASPEIDQKRGVDTVNTLGAGLGRTSAGLARIANVFGSSQRLQGRERGSSPTSGTCFPLSGACEPLTVHKLCWMGPFGGLFHWWLVVWPGASSPAGSDGLSFVTSSWAFMARPT